MHVFPSTPASSRNVPSESASCLKEELDQLEKTQWGAAGMVKAPENAVAKTHLNMLKDTLREKTL